MTSEEFETAIAKHRIGLKPLRRELLAHDAELRNSIAEFKVAQNNLARAVFGDAHYEAHPDACEAEFAIDAMGACQIIRRQREIYWKAEQRREQEIVDRSIRANQDENLVSSLRKENERLTGEIKEIVICAAIRMPDGEVIRGHRHNNCYDVVRARPDKVREDIVRAAQGFLTSQNRFVCREEAMKIQRAAGISSAQWPDGKLRGDSLFSEDLY